MAELELVRERKLAEMFPGLTEDDRLEASGVCARDGALHVVFDNIPQVVRVTPDLGPERTIFTSGQGTGYEDLAYDDGRGRFLALAEAEPDGDGTFRPRVDEFDDAFRLLESSSLPFEIEDENKGLEGLTVIQLHGESVIVALCEGNRCKGGKAGRTPGGGRLPVFGQEDGGWSLTAVVELPASLPFEDYAAVDLEGSQMAVLSQSSARVWVGEVDRATWTLVDVGMVYELPEDTHEKTRYCNAEGLAWIGDRELAVVSDRRKKSQHKRCADTDQSIHVFRIPG